MIKRINRLPAEWRRLFKQQERGGQTVGEFCAERKINVNSFYSKRKKLRALSERGRFIEIAPRMLGRPGAWVIVEAGGIRIEVHDRAALREVLAAVRETTC